MTYQPLQNHLKGRYDLTLFTSELNINPKERDKIMFEDGTHLMVSRVLPQKTTWVLYVQKKVSSDFGIRIMFDISSDAETGFRIG